jgi:hypothetical protein
MKNSRIQFQMNIYHYGDFYIMHNTHMAETLSI